MLDCSSESNVSSSTEKLDFLLQGDNTVRVHRIRVQNLLWFGFQSDDEDEEPAH